uniref:CSON006021 protein n=1 Tax=Culicoides sonorensis TaxID=179676 RepID=A0A336LN12_CULSO
MMIRMFQHKHKNTIKFCSAVINVKSSCCLLLDARPSSPTLLDNTGHPAPDHQTQMKGPGGMMGPQLGTNYGQQQQGPQGGMMQNHNQQQQQPHLMQNQQMRPGQPQQMGNQSQMQHQAQQPQATTASSTGLGGLASGLFSSATNAAFGNKQQPQKGVPQVVPQPGMASGPGGMMGQQQQQPMMGQQQQPMQQQPQQSHNPLGGFNPFGGGQQQQQQPQQPGMQGQPGQPGAGPSILGKLTDMTAPGGDMLSKGKELIFMKFGLGGK